ncbi:MAG: LuxR C-terminal-related transcriptional regulator, partial [Chitinispirillia bacterium]|nr:LuxR C-terminal-related transcriptional regulator [Chitinispirillia bacterium]
CRDMPKVNIDTLQIKGFISEINDTDLNFTESELAEYLRHEGLSCASQTVREIYEDTGGWAFSVNLAARSLKRAPNYTGFVKATLKENVFKLMEAESWDSVSKRIKRFLARLSLVDTLSAKLVDILADGDENLLAELKEQSAYLRYDSYGGIYLIHHLFLDFLRTKQDILNDKEKRETYKAAAEWCNKNNLKIDALSYYEKIEDYDSIVSILWDLCEHMSYDISFYAVDIFERTPAKVFEQIDFFAAAHLLTLFCLNRSEELIKLAKVYEKKLAPLPKDDTFRNHTLGGVYFFWGCMRRLMSTKDGNYDFNVYLSKAAECLSKVPVKPDLVVPIGSWGSAVGSAKAGDPQKFAEAMAQMMNHFSSCINNSPKGLDCLCQGELMFYQKELRAAKPVFFQALESAKEHKQYEIIHRSLFYMMRMAIADGDRAKFEWALKNTAELLENENYTRRFTVYDITLGWYACAIHRFDIIPEWLKSEFASYNHASHIENFGNQIRARYYYSTKNYLPLLSYIREMKQRESILFGRVEMLAMEACIHYKMKDRTAAFAALKAAYEEASPNNIIWPFIELGKDMKTLADNALKTECNIPAEWLKDISRKSSSYAKQLSALIANYSRTPDGITALSPRESEILRNLYKGHSRPEVANNLGLSINTINSAVIRIYGKLNASNIADAVRIATEHKLV